MELRTNLSKLENLFLCFFLYSVIGWLYEVFLEVVVYQMGFSNRGFLFGPYLPVYGCGALLFLLLLYRPSKRKIRLFKINVTPFLIFLGCGLIATVVELLTSYGLDLLGLKLWDYSRYAWNFQGRIALNPSVRFGLGGLLFLYGLQPLFDKLTARLTPAVRHGLTLLLSLTMVTDLVVRLWK